MNKSRVFIFSLVLCVIGFSGIAQADNPTLFDTEWAKSLLTNSGIKGGLVVHLGCDDGKRTALFRPNDRFLVHGLDTDINVIKTAREYIKSKGLYGDISFDQWNGKILPYVENAVNLLIVESPAQVNMEEIKRILSPNGVAFIKHDDMWQKIVKPRPDDIDEWTHYLYQPNNNAVSKDTAVDPPRHLQWIGGPKWSRQHDHMSSSSAIVSANGRNFYIFDEGSPVSIQLPSDWKLIARDAFNGKIVWKRPIDFWQTQMFRLKSGPAQLPRRIVAIEDTVYVTLSLNAPVTALNAATGETLKTYDGTQATEEIIYSDGVLYLLINDGFTDDVAARRGYSPTIEESPRHIMAVNAKSGEVAWKKPWRWVTPVSLTIANQSVYFYDGERIISLNQKDGNERWQSEKVGRRRSVPSYYAPTLVVHNDTVLFSGADPESEAYHTDNGQTIIALDAESGDTLWTGEHPAAGYRSPEDILVIDGLVWTGELFMGRDSGIFTGRDPRTGEVKVEFPPDVDTHWFHHRCYRAKATVNYLLTSRTGIEFVDFREKHWTCNHWVRGACLYGIMPANGMIYTSPHPCACYLEAKLYGFNALAPATRSRQIPDDFSDDSRRQTGPAFEVMQTVLAESSHNHDWPTYRHDTERSGFTTVSIPTQLSPAWDLKIGDRLSSLVIADNQLYVADIDKHTLHALNASNGESRWTYTAGGRIDSPPTVWNGRVMFGSRDGYVYSLRADDGELIWRFRAAPMDRRVIAFEQLESVWPVHGNVLMVDAEQSASGKAEVWCAAGRSMFLDGGLRLLRLDAITGQLIDEQKLDENLPDTQDNLQTQLQGLNMPVALNDIMSCDGDYIYMRTQRFNKQGERLDIANPTGNIRQQQGEGAHLFSPTGFIDDAYWHRSYWVYGKRWASGAGGYYKAGRFAPSGRLMVFNDDTIYAFGRKPTYFRWTTPLERHLYASSKTPEIVRIGPKPTKPGFKGPVKPDEKIGTQWTEEIPLYVQAMVLADNTIFVVGPPDIIDEDKTLKAFETPDVQKLLSKQNQAIQGSKGSSLWAVSAKDGKKLGEVNLKSLPVWDGMAAADNRLFLAMKNGHIVCLAE